MPRNRLQAGTDCSPEPIDWFQEPTMKAKIEILKDLKYWVNSAKEWADLAHNWVADPSLCSLPNSGKRADECVARGRGAMMMAARASKQLAELAGKEPAVPVGPEDWDL